MTFTPVADPVFTHTLSTPIQYLGEAIGEIAVRAPTAGDMMRHGNPVRYDLRFDPPQLEIEPEKAMKMLAALSGLPIGGTLDRLTPSDALSIYWGFARFFIPGF
jgi:hypothetical protein